MGTRHLTCVVIDNDFKVAQYGQWDGYPEGQGTTILEFLHYMQKEGFAEEFKTKLRQCAFMDHRELEMVYANAHAQGGLPPHISRDTGAEILSMIAQSEKGLRLKDSRSFAGDSLFCEFAYVLDFDKGTFEVYRGFNHEPLAETERFHGFPVDGTEYHPVKHAKTFSLLNPPSEDDFLKEFQEEEAEA